MTPSLPATYSGDPLSSPVDEVRFLVGDTNMLDPQLSDAEISYCLTLVYGPTPPAVWPSMGNYLPAAYCADAIVAKYKFLVDESVGDLHISYAKTQAQFQAVANRMRSRASIKSVPVYCGGLSLAAKVAQYRNNNLLGTAVRVDGMDNVDTMNNIGNIANNAGGSDIGGNAPPPSVRSFAQSFTSATTVTVIHNFGTLSVVVSVWSSAGDSITPQSITANDANSVTVTFGVPLSGLVVVQGA